MSISPRRTYRTEQVYCRVCRRWEWLDLEGNAECGHGIASVLTRRQFNAIRKRLKDNVEDFRREVWIGYDSGAAR